ncbi:diaminopimelate decarboxylase [Geminicoccus roseus]|uniref:diaminopimelate decarboxylase n=1 Tax=Geminicoccus roseus TaxID=404900 RepID=UPI0004018616|nr:diaminopimelate decarboxylase [Geminicoccus roseus]
MTGMFQRRDGRLFAEEVALTDIAEAVGTPVYVNSANGMRQQARILQEAFAGQDVRICYAVKANHHLAVLRLFAGMGLGMDTVSGGEIARSIRAGCPPDRIVFAGIAKDDDEMRLGLQHGIYQFNVESVEELHRLDQVARAVGRRAPVALRVNPNVAAGGHDKISTGRKGDKFGVPLEDALEILTAADGMEGVEPVGLHCHIGSQIVELAPFETAYQRVIEAWRAIRAGGVALSRIDFGGGFGVRYQEPPRFRIPDYAAMVKRLTAGLGATVVLEPGRFLVAEQAVLLTRAIYLKQTADHRFLVLDAGMNTLIRPAMYGAWHDIEPVEGGRGDEAPTEVVGPICESSDFFARGRMLPRLEGGDLVAILQAGAYGSVMASDYNSRPGPAEVMVDGSQFDVITRRRPVELQFEDEVIPRWLG